ncbi:MAG TPA: S8 family serine peptidase [Thermoanaerobaculia bacterium]|nr:S8 family serine peptidase [Thermoanaerobaculia bacterium]
MTLPLMPGKLLHANTASCESRLIVKPRNPEEFADLLQKVTRDKGLPLPHLREIGGLGKFLIETATPRQSTRLQDALEFYLPSELESIRRDVQLRLDAIPNDKKWPQWNLEKIGAPSAWDSMTDSSAIVVAVLDSGVDAAHDDLRPNLWRAPAGFTVKVKGRTIICNAGDVGFDAIDGDCVPQHDDLHGTHVAGIIGAVGNNDLGVTGVSWRATVMPIRIFEKRGNKVIGCAADAIEALEFVREAKRAYPAVANIRVVNASWGSKDESPDLRAEIERVVADNILFVTTAGNDSANIDQNANKYYPASWTLTIPEIIPVAASSLYDKRFSQSSYGPHTIPLAAPGVLILSTVPGSKFRAEKGTSMAAAHVSGAAALLIATCATNTTDTKRYLLDYAEEIPALEPFVEQGRRLCVDLPIAACRADLAKAPVPVPD